MRQAGALMRRLTGTPDWPYVATAVLCTVGIIEVAFRSAEDGSNATLALLLALAVTLPVGLIRGHPTAAAVLVVAGTALTLSTYGFPPVAGLIALAVVLYLAGRRGSRSALLVLPFLVYAVSPAATAAPGGRQFAVLLLGLAAGASGTGIFQRRRTEAAKKDASVRAMADSMLEHAARGERARIARELHDVVAHHISLIAVQAEAARLTTPGMPPEGATRLIAIGDTARTALTEMRRLLGVLREDAGAAPTRKPQPGLQQLNELLDEARELSVGGTRLIVRGAVTPLDPGIEITAYRIVQEALTNARRHAPGAAVDVELDYRDEALHLSIRDNGPGPPPGS
ncbi:MAG TPA: histidine kinase, partial [Jiangellales bacterium]|nr:histidine kinase [Jiangellales bacterium]